MWEVDEGIAACLPLLGQRDIHSKGSARADVVPHLAGVSQSLQGAAGRGWAAGLIHQHDKNCCRARFGSSGSSRWVSRDRKGEERQTPGTAEPWGDAAHSSSHVEITTGGFTRTPRAHSIIWAASSLHRA